jgi:hypothetical protein
VAAQFSKKEEAITEVITKLDGSVYSCKEDRGQSNSTPSQDEDESSTSGSFPPYFGTNYQLEHAPEFSQIRTCVASGSELSVTSQETP